MHATSSILELMAPAAPCTSSSAWPGLVAGAVPRLAVRRYRKKTATHRAVMQSLDSQNRSSFSRVCEGTDGLGLDRFPAWPMPSDFSYPVPPVGMWKLFSQLAQSSHNEVTYPPTTGGSTWRRFTSAFPAGAHALARGPTPEGLTQKRELQFASRAVNSIEIKRLVLRAANPLSSPKRYA